MAIKEFNVDLDVKGRVLATTVPNSTGSIVTWNSSTKVFGLRSNSQILSDLGLTSVVSNSHTHTNKSILDGITSVKVSNWDTAYGWGDFRQYGLGIKSDHNSDANDSRLWDNGFYTLGASSINRPLYVSNSYASGILTISETTTRRVQIATGGNQTGRLAFRSITNSTQGDWLEFWHSGNLTNVSQLNNDAGYLTNSTAKYIAIGNGSQTGVGNGNAENLRNGSVWSTPTTGGIPSSNGAVVSFNPYSNGNYGFQLGARSNKFYGRTLENGTLNNWVQFWHEGNFSQTNINNWNTAFGWGRGIKIDGNSEGVHNLLSLDANLIKNSSVWVNSGSANIPNYGPSKGAPIVNFTPYKSGATEYGFSISARENRILFNTKEASVVGDWLELYHSGNFNPSDYALVSQLTGYVPTSRTITAGNGLSGGGNLTVNRTISLGTPSPIGLTSTNSVTSTSHTHALDEATITAINQGVTAHGWGDFRDFGLGTTATISNDWDSITATGFYRNTTPNATGLPIAVNTISVIHIEMSSTNATQTAYRSGDTQTWFRVRNNSVWSAWVQFFHSGNFNPSNYALVSQLPTVNNGALTLSTGTGLTGSATFTANQSGSSTFSVAVASTHKLPTVTEWNALPTTDTITRLRGTTSGTYTSGDLTLLAGSNVSISQSGSNFTISATNTNTTYSAGTGLSLTGTTFGQTITTSGTGSFVTGITQTTNGFQVNLGTPPNTTYSAGSGLTLSGTTFSLPITYSGSGNYIANIVQSTNGLTVTRATLPTFTDAITSISRDGVNIPIVSQNVDIPVFSTSGAGLVPARVGSTTTRYLREDGTWVTPTNTTYSAGTLALLEAGTNTTSRVWSAKILADYVTSMIPTSILSYSSANGIVVTDWNSYALSEYAMSLGYGSVTSGNYATSVGGLLSTTGFGSTNQGYSNSITKSLGYALGAYNSVRATLSGAFGIGLVNRNDGAFVVGRYNSELPIEPYDTTSPHKQAVFAIGAGRDDTDRYTAVTVYGDGRADYTEGYDDSNWTNNTLVTKKWVQDNAGGGGGLGYKNVNDAAVFDLSVEYHPSMVENVYHVMTEQPVVFIGGNEVFHDGYKVTIMVSDDVTNISLDNTQAVKFISGEYSLISSLDPSHMSITFIYDKEYSRFRVYHHSYTSGL